MTYVTWTLSRSLITNNCVHPISCVCSAWVCYAFIWLAFVTLAWVRSAQYGNLVVFRVFVCFCFVVVVVVWVCKLHMEPGYTDNGATWKSNRHFTRWFTRPENLKYYRQPQTDRLIRDISRSVNREDQSISGRNKSLNSTCDSMSPDD